MSWDPLKDVKKSLKKIEDSVNKDVFDDVLGIEDLSQAARTIALGGTPFDAAAQAQRERGKDKESGAKVAAAESERKAQEARDLPTVLANQARAARRKRQRGMSLMATGAGDGGGALLSTVMATGKQTLGA